MDSCNQWTYEWAQQNSIAANFSPSVPSTNKWAKETFHPSSSLCVFLTDHQSAGRGRFERTWTDIPGKTLLSTWCFFAATAPQPIFACRLGLLLYQSLKNLNHELPLSMKAPNDLYLGDGKLSGFLVELQQHHEGTNYFIGLGMNVLSAPGDVGVSTSFLNDFVKISSKNWMNFCHLFSQGLRELQKDPQRALLLESERKNILSALNQHPKEKYLDLDATGRLQTRQGHWLLWSDL